MRADLGTAGAGWNVTTMVVEVSRIHAVDAEQTERV